MAVVSRIATVAINAGGTGSRIWQATAATQDTAAGSSVVVTVTTSSSGLTPPDTSDSLTLSLRIDNTATSVRTFTLTPGLASQTATFFFTSTGVSGAANRAGTLRLRIDAEKNSGALTSRYTVNSDDAVGQSLPALWAISQRDQGWVRSTTSYTTTLSNVGYAGAQNAPAEYAEALYGQLTLAATAYASAPVTVYLANLTDTPRSSVLSSTSVFSKTWSGTSVTDGRVNRGFPALQDTFFCKGNPGNAGLTGLPWTTFSGVTEGGMAVDPRLTAVHLMQLDDNSYGIGPLTKQESTGERPSTSIGYVTTAIHAARGSSTTTTVTGGVNGIDLQVTLGAASGAGAPVTRNDTTATKGGEAGWQGDFLVWTSSLPGGSWNKTVLVTGPSDIGGVATYLRQGSASYTLIASRNPFVKLVVDAGHSGTGDNDRHLQNGDDLEVACFLEYTKDGQEALQEFEAGTTPVVAIKRVRANQVEYWNGTAFVVANPTFGVLAMTQVSTYVWTYVATSDSDWSDVIVQVFGQYLGVRYDGEAPREFVGNFNTHAAASPEVHGLDALDLALNGTISKA